MAGSDSSVEALDGLQVSNESAQSVSFSQVSSSTVSKDQRCSKRSWVWTYFEQDAGPSGDFVVCTAKQNGRPCGRHLKRDRTGSTKSMTEHLMGIHKLGNPEKISSRQATIDRYMMTKKLALNKLLTSKTLKTAIGYFIAEADLPLSVVERPALMSLLELCNPAVGSLMVKRDAIKDHITEMFLFHRQHIIDLVFSKLPRISITTDVWTSPATESFISITAHYIEDGFQIKSVLLALAQLQGNHSGANIADHIWCTLKEYGIESKLHAITADNASSNATMALALENLSDGDFSAQTCILGCVAHVINLVANEGLETLKKASVPEDRFGAENDYLNPMAITSITTTPDGATVPLKSIISRIHSLAVSLRHSPQKSKKFHQTVQLNHDGSGPVGATSLLVDVKTRWNSTYHMLQRACDLKSSYNHFCSSPEFNQYSLTNLEWEQVVKIQHILRPLSDATEFLCGSTYPTLNLAIPMYISLIKKLKSAQQAYDSDQVFKPLENMLAKLDHYLKRALDKPAANCATILDPRIKMLVYNRNFDVLSRYNLCEGNLKAKFIEHVKDLTHRGLANYADTPSEPSRTLAHSRNTNCFDEDFFERSPQVSSSIENEIQLYLAEVVQPKGTDILGYWKVREASSPNLAQLARVYLAIPATSAPSERVFSLGRKVISFQRHSLSSSSVDKLVCLKEWLRVFGPIYQGCEV